ncbi:MAG: VWA domain-containing protein [Lachnospiraceae bacterium]|nr:VWA domain-containing protein [Lachnospiraceae bacterium]
MESKKNNAAGVVIIVVVLIAIVIAAIVKSGLFGKNGPLSGGISGGDKKEVSTLIKRVKYDTKDPVKGSVDLSQASLYDEIPNINKYPLSLENTTGDINIEIFASPEKAGEGADSWMVDVAKKYNNENHKINGKVVKVSIRNISSGVAADYIISGKYIPTGFSPSSELWGEYASIQGGKLNLIEKSVVKNVPGILISKKTDYLDYKSIIKDVQEGKINVGYTNPQASTTGMNLLLTILMDADPDITSDASKEAFSKFQKNIPYVATNTMQMRDSNASGSLDGMTMEYQSFIQDKELKSNFKFIPFGVRHDNPMYECSGLNDDKKAALEDFTKYCVNDENQKAATNKGFNNNLDYKSDLKITGKDVKNALSIYKQEKDGGKSIIAVFVADVSGSMYGEPLNQLKSSLSNGMKYINETNQVGLISYSSTVSIEVPIKKFDLNQKAFFQGSIDNMQANGNTASYDALVVAMDMIEKAKKDSPNAKCVIFLLSDGQANTGYNLSTITPALKKLEIPVYTISYGEDADTNAMQSVSKINEAASIKADSDDIIYQIKNLFNSNL